MQPAHLGNRQIGPGRIVWIGDKHDPGALGDSFQQRIDIGRQIALRRGDWGGADRQGADRVHQKPVPAVQHLGRRDRHRRAAACRSARPNRSRRRCEPGRDRERGRAPRAIRWPSRRDSDGCRRPARGTRRLPSGWAPARFRSMPVGSAARRLTPSTRRRHKVRYRGSPVRAPARSVLSSPQPRAAIPAGTAAIDATPDVPADDSSAAESGTA